jgi:NADH:ubiquinone oxidoreductase subunit 3 (subunit A)
MFVSMFVLIVLVAIAVVGVAIVALSAYRLLSTWRRRGKPPELREDWWPRFESELELQGDWWPRFECGFRAYAEHASRAGHEAGPGARDGRSSA